MYEFDLEKNVYFILLINLILSISFRDFSNTYEVQFSLPLAHSYTHKKTYERKIALKLFHDDIKLHDFNFSFFFLHFPPHQGKFISILINSVKS